MSGPLPAVLTPLTVPASWGYGWIIGRRNARYDRGVGCHRVSASVISVGNLTTGGSGKTPMVAWIVERLQERGRRPMVAMRGYAARPDVPSDEEAEYAQRLPGVPVVANPDRVTTIRAALDRDEADCVVLDDGFQHRRLHRDLDLVLIDATAATLSDRLLPAGHLREPVSSLGRADAVIMTHAESVDEALAERVARWHGRSPEAWTRHHWPGLSVWDGSGCHQEPTEWLSGRHVLTMLGVARPHHVRRLVEEKGASIAADVPARDHERYDRSKMIVARGLCDGVDAMVLTGKDWVKVRQLIDMETWPCPIVVPQLRLEFLTGGDELAALIEVAVR